MKSCVMSMAALMLMPSVSIADLPDVAYAVPEGKAGNTPQTPYATWQTAANDIRVAAGAIEGFGVVNALEGTYPSPDGLVNTRGAYELRVLGTEEGDEAGTLTLENNYLFNDPIETDDPDRHLVRVMKGTLTTTETSVFVDRGSATKGLDTSYKLVFSGSEAFFVKNGGYLYSGYDMRNTALSFVHGAKCICSRIYLGQHANGRFASLTVADGASVSLSGVCQCGAEAAGCVVVVSNAVVSANNYVFGKSGMDRGLEILLAGEAPRLVSNSSAVFNGDTVVNIDISEMPLTGYANYVLYNSDITFAETASIRIKGAEALRARLRGARIMSLVSNVGISFGGGAKMTLPSSVVDAANEELAGTGFSLSVSGAYITLRYVEQGKYLSTVYADAGCPSSALPYATWETASVTFGDAAFFLAKGGEMRFANGDYSDGYATPEQAATYRAFRSSAEDAPGTVTIGSTLFPGLAGVNTDPQKHLLTLAYGTFVVPDDMTVFLDSSSAGAAQNSSNRLMVVGANTVFNDKSHDLYVGYSAQNTHLIVRDHAKCYAKTVYSGRSANGPGSLIVVESRGLLEIAQQLTMGRQSANAGLVVDDATVTCRSFDCGAEGTTFGERICLKGAAPSLNSSTAVAIGGNAVLEFDVSGFPAGGMSDGCVSTKDFSMTDASSLKLVGLEQLKVRLDSDRSGPRVVSYRLVYAWGSFDISDERLEAARLSARLPDGWTLEKEGRYLTLTARKRRGMLITVK